MCKFLVRIVQRGTTLISKGQKKVSECESLAGSQAAEPSSFDHAGGEDTSSWLTYCLWSDRKGEWRNPPYTLLCLRRRYVHEELHHRDLETDAFVVRFSFLYNTQHRSVRIDVATHYERAGTHRPEHDSRVCRSMRYDLSLELLGDLPCTSEADVLRSRYRSANQGNERIRMTRGCG